MINEEESFEDERLMKKASGIKPGTDTIILCVEVSLTFRLKY